MKRVLKWTIPVDDRDHPIGRGPVVHVAPLGDTSTAVQVWTEEDGTQPPTRAVRVYGTGHQIPDQDTHVGSVVTKAGLVWHIYGAPQ